MSTIAASNEQLLQEIREVNLAYLMLAQHMIRADKAQALYRLGEIIGVHEDQTGAVRRLIADTGLERHILHTMGQIDVDIDKRHTEFPELEKESLEDRDQLIKNREKEIKQRQKDAEAELKELEKSGAKEADIRVRQKLIDKDLQAITDRYAREIDLTQRALDTFGKMHTRMIVEDEELWREIKDRYSEYFVGGTGAEAIKSLIDTIDFDAEELLLRDAITNGFKGKVLSTQRKQKAIKRLKIIASFNRRDDSGRLVNNPKAMVLDVIPVIPPDLRPMVQLEGGRFANNAIPPTAGTCPWTPPASPPSSASSTASPPSSRPCSPAATSRTSPCR